MIDIFFDQEKQHIVDPRVFRPGTKLPEMSLNIVLNRGGLGDFIARAPAIKYLADTCWHLKITVWLPEFGLELYQYWFRNHPRVMVKNRAFFQAKYDRKGPVRDQDHGMFTTMQTHLVEHGFGVIANVGFSQVPDEYKSYLPIETKQYILTKPIPLPEKYAIVTTGATAKTRQLPASTVNAIVKHLKDKHDLTPVFLGKEKLSDDGVYHAKFDEGIDYSTGVDLRNKTTLLEAAKVVEQAKVVVGIDNGLLHLSACVPDVPIVWGFSNLDPKHRLPFFRDNQYVVEPPQSLTCRGCQSKMGMMYQHDFLNCLYSDYLCLSQMTPEMFNAKIDEAING